jgi:5-(carboxyamino)imidazole ribonucleotide mutase
MLAISDEALAEKLAAEKKSMAEGVIAKDKALQDEIANI